MTEINVTHAIQHNFEICQFYFLIALLIISIYRKTIRVIGCSTQ